MNGIERTPEKEAWDAFVGANSSGTFSHLYGWSQALAKVYRLPLFRLAISARPGSKKYSAVLALLRFTPSGEPSRLISLPYSDGAGILADDERSAVLLLEAAERLAEEQGCFLELRQGAGTAAVAARVLAGRPGYQAHSFKVMLARPLYSSSERLWADLTAKVRNQVRKARRNACVGMVGGSELLEDYYAVFAENMRDLGSPVHSKDLFARVLKELGERGAIALVRQKGKAVAGAVVIRCGDTLSNPWASSLRSYRPLCPNMLLYWTMLEYGCRTGCKVFDFGRSSPQASTCRFKRQWGGKPSALVWYVRESGEACWNPRSEGLEYGWIKRLPVRESIRRGPAMRRWISL